MKLSAIIAALASLALAAGVACALEPSQVLVVANAKSADSKALAKAYIEARKIPAKNLLLVTTTTEYDVSRDDYEKNIRLPIKQYLEDNKLKDDIRCICLIYGVPVRIAPIQLPAPAQEMFKVYRVAVDKTADRLAVDRQFLSSIGKSFPQPKTTELRPAAKLFDAPASEAAAPTSFSKLMGETLSGLVEKQAELAKIKDPAKRKIASRQLMALHLDIGGLKGLCSYIHTAKPDDAPKADDLEKQLAELEKKFNDLQSQPRSPDVAAEELDLTDQMRGLSQVHSLAVSKAALLGPGSTDAAVDSELSLLWWDDHYNPGGWMPNMLSWRNQPQPSEEEMPPTLMAARIDGPSRDDVARIIRNSVDVEAKGLKGSFYIDAGGLQVAYDQHLIGLDKFVTKNTKFPCVIDKREALFPPNSCPDAALYVGWYSLGRYVPCCIWTRGAVGWHIASCEAKHLRDPNSKEWAVKMIQNGVVATVAAVNEPYLGAFPLPDEFYPLLMTGKYTLAECYWRTTPMASWRITLIGDPLYNPFKANPQLEVSALPKDLVPPPEK